MGRLNDLPQEVLAKVVEQIKGRESLKYFSCASKALRAAALPFLFRSRTLHLNGRASIFNISKGASTLKYLHRLHLKICADVLLELSAGDIDLVVTNLKAVATLNELEVTLWATDGSSNDIYTVLSTCDAYIKIAAILRRADKSSAVTPSTSIVFILSDQRDPLIHLEGCRDLACMIDSGPIEIALGDRGSSWHKHIWDDTPADHLDPPVGRCVLYIDVKEPKDSLLHLSKLGYKASYLYLGALGRPSTYIPDCLEMCYSNLRRLFLNMIQDNLPPVLRKHLEFSKLRILLVSGITSDLFNQHLLSLRAPKLQYLHCALGVADEAGLLLSRQFSNFLNRHRDLRIIYVERYAQAGRWSIELPDWERFNLELQSRQIQFKFHHQEDPGEEPIRDYFGTLYHGSNSLCTSFVYVSVAVGSDPPQPAGRRPMRHYPNLKTLLVSLSTKVDAADKLIELLHACDMPALQNLVISVEGRLEHSLFYASASLLRLFPSLSLLVMEEDAEEFLDDSSDYNAREIDIPSYFLDACKAKGVSVNIY